MSALFDGNGRLTAIVVGYLLSPEEAFVYSKELPSNKIVEVLATQSGNITAQESATYAARTGWTEGLKCCLTWAAKFKEPIGKNTALCCAADNGHTFTMELLKEFGATNFNWALRHAASGGHIAAMELAKSWGATDFDGALRTAAESGHNTAMTLAKSWGASNFNWALRHAASGGHTAALRG